MFAMVPWDPEAFKGLLTGCYFWILFPIVFPIWCYFLWKWLIHFSDKWTDEEIEQIDQVEAAVTTAAAAAIAVGQAVKDASAEADRIKAGK